MKVTERIKLLKQFAVVFANEHSVNFAICSIRRQRVRAKHSSNHKDSQMLLCFATSVSQKELASRPRARRPELPSKIPGSL